MGMRILESNPKSHEERGLVERIIRTMTALQWEPLFSKVVNTLDNLPIAKGNATATGNLGSEIITQMG